MMTNFSSKILLFGEYTILKGSMALALPYNIFSGSLVLPSDEDILERKHLVSNSHIKKLAVEISHKEPFASNDNIFQFLEDSLLGLFFESNIPENYGIGSSGALVAALYNKYFSKIEKKDLFHHAQIIQLKAELAELESFFHGESSGIDPLVSYLNQPILINAPSNHFVFQIPDNIKVFLIDTNQPSATKNLVNLFFEKCVKQADDFMNLIQLNNRAIKSFLELSPSAFERIDDFCKLEQKLLPEMFQNSEQILTITSKFQEQVCVKLCGSGGGGFLLGFSRNGAFGLVKEQLEKHNFKVDLIRHGMQTMASL